MQVEKSSEHSIIQCLCLNFIFVEDLLKKTMEICSHSSDKLRSAWQLILYAKSACTDMALRSLGNVDCPFILLIAHLPFVYFQGTVNSS